MKCTDHYIYLYREFLGDPDLNDGNPRDTEDSRTVVRYWFNPNARYATEDIRDVRCLRLVAERLVVRRILGLGSIDAAFESQVARTEVFGPGTPIFSELAMPSVFIAMAFVPLKPTTVEGNPRLARLYCVGGLETQHVLPLDGMGEETLQGLSWFIDGVPTKELKHGIGGRSWLLAANLLAEIVRKRDMQTARNFAKHFIVTGNVEHGAIGIVDMDKKVDLANVEQFENFKWIIPKENDMEPKRKIEKPATLEQAYKLIESMQSVATRSLFNALRKADIDEAKVQYAQMGADIYAIEKDTGLSVLEVVADEIEKCRKDTSRPETEREARISVLREIMMWLKQENADCAMMFYLLAQSGDEGSIASCKESYPINAIDENGLTAVDWALNEGNWDLAKKLYALGGRCNARYGGNAKLCLAIKRLCWEDVGLFSDSERNLIINAIKTGLSPAIEVSGASVMQKDKEPCGEWEECTLKGTLFALAILRHDVQIVAACLDNGADCETNPVVVAMRTDGSGRFIGCGHTLIESVKDRIEEEERYRPHEYGSSKIDELKQIVVMLEAHGFPAKRERSEYIEESFGK